MSGLQREPAAGEERAADAALRAIAEPRRRAILRLVARGELDAARRIAEAEWGMAVDDRVASAG